MAGELGENFGLMPHPERHIRGSQQPPVDQAGCQKVRGWLSDFPQRGKVGSELVSHRFIQLEFEFLRFNP